MTSGANATASDSPCEAPEPPSCISTPTRSASKWLAIVSQNPALRDLALADHALVLHWDDLDEVLARALASLPESAEKQAARRAFFLQELSLAANRQRLQGLLAELPAEPNPGLAGVMGRVLPHLPGFPRELLGLVESA